MVTLADTRASTVNGLPDGYQAQITRVESTSQRTVLSGQKWVAIPTEWMKAWRAYCESQGTRPAPPPISFSSLIDHEISTTMSRFQIIITPPILRIDLQEIIDYVLTPWDTFLYLREMYGAEDNVLVFDTVQMGLNNFKIELHPPLICYFDVNGHILNAKCVSRTTIVSQLVKEKRVWVEVKAQDGLRSTLTDSNRPPCKVH